jgi:hypothetical protein
VNGKRWKDEVNEEEFENPFICVSYLSEMSDCGGMNYNQANNSCVILKILGKWDPNSLNTGPGTERQQFFLSPGGRGGVYTAISAVVSAADFNPASAVHELILFL